MDNIISEARSMNDSTFLNHIFCTSEEGKAEILNVVQYAVMGILPVVALNKTIQKFIPEADVEKSSLEVLAEVFIQIVIMFIGVVLIHRLITYFPTYSGYKYEAFNLTTVILAFLVIVLSLQTKLGIKVNILVEADTLDNSGVQNGVFPPAPAMATSNRSSGQGHDYMLKASGQGAPMSDFNDFSPAPANSALAGGSFW